MSDKEEEKKPRKKREPKEKKEKEPKTQTRKKTTTGVAKKTLAQMQRENPQDIIVPVDKTSKCPKGTRKNKEGLCILTKDFKDTFLKRKACIQQQRDLLE
jgi:hypothetical protein